MASDQRHTPKGGGFQGGSLLDAIDSPADLKRLEVAKLDELAAEIRAKIISTAAANGGHLAPHLGVVELSIALHYVYDTPNDLVIWDVGHQSYAHKLLTGRREAFPTIRKKGGLCGYPTPRESPYDPFGVGHSSTSISAALGMAVARDRQGGSKKIAAVIGDGAMTAGMAFEALSHAGAQGSDMLVILNDNEMSISKSVGALSAYFNRLVTSGLYNRAKGDVKTLLERTLGSNVTKAAQRFEHSVKGFLMPGTLFEALGCRYVGPFDGHDLPGLVECLQNLREMGGPIFFHCVTQKGKGYSYAEDDPQTYHGVKAFDIDTGRFVSPGAAPSEPKTPSFTEAFTNALQEAAREDSRVMGVTAAMAAGTGIAELQKEFPKRFLDVDICEQHAVTFSAGLATQGMRPVCAIYSTFLQRGYDQVIHDVCLQNLPVVFALDRAGAVGEDSPTQQGAFDLSFLRSVPNLTILVPRDGEDLRAMLFWALRQTGPVALRYARGKAPTIEGLSDNGTGRRKASEGEILREGKDAVLLGVGPVLKACLEAASRLEEEGLQVGVADAKLVKPLDTGLLERLRGTPLITVEENTVVGGFGSGVLEYLEQTGRLGEAPIRRLGFPDAFISHATRDEQLADLGLDANGIFNAARDFLGQAKPRENAPLHAE